jgi:diguanylate cyclase (GGDEF)-like protein
VLLAVVAMAPLLVDRIGSMEAARSARVAAAERHAVELARAGAERQTDILAGARSLLQSVGHAVERISARGRECNRLLGDIASDIAWTRSLMVADTGGRVLCSSNPQRLGTDISGASYFDQAIVTGDLAFSDPIYTSNGADPVVMAAYPRRDANGATTVIITAAINMSRVGPIPVRLRRKPNAVALMADTDGTVVAEYPHEARWLGRDIDGTALMRAVKANPSGTTIARDFGDITRIWGFHDLPSGHGYLLVGLDEHGVMQQVEKDMVIAYVQLALTVMLMLLGAWFFGERTILRPIQALARHAERIGRGDLSVRTGKPKWATEFLPLARALDSMAERLGEREHDLRLQSEHFRELATLDALTGLSNRRAFDHYIAVLWDRAVKSRTSLALLMIDVDHFKRFNDHYGHPEGDACLRAVADTLRDISGPTARAARYGGEEFALLFFGTPADARAMAEAVRYAVAALGVPHAGAPGGIVTVSIGSAALVPDRTASAGGLVAAADAALYESKRRRNAVTAYQPLAMAKAG